MMLYKLQNTQCNDFTNWYTVLIWWNMKDDWLRLGDDCTHTRLRVCTCTCKHTQKYTTTYSGTGKCMYTCTWAQQVQVHNKNN
jgi:hypothetical protein